MPAIGYNGCMSTASNIPAVHIPASMTQQITVVEITRELSSMYPIIGCEIVERVSLDKNYRAALWVDEMGLLRDAPLNLRASCIAGRHIFGDAIMAGECAETFDIVPLSIACPKVFFDMVEQEARVILKNLSEQEAA